jgi:hypothetical protein
MNIKIAIPALLALVAGFAAGLSGGYFISPAHAAGNTILTLRANQTNEIENYCNFDKTVLYVHYTDKVFCVAK